MIQYNSSGYNFILNLFALDGSVFPKALKISVPSSLCTGVLVALIYDFEFFPYFKDPEAVMNNNAIWGGFSFFVGFLVVFRTSQAYNRFWEGCTSTHKMGAEWFDCCAALMAFCKFSTAGEDSVLSFQNTLIRLFSMLHAAALGEIEDCGEQNQNYAKVAAFKMELIDGEALDEECLRAIRDSDAKVELIFQWIQQLIVENIKTGVLSIAPPILTRSFQEIANGMVHFHDALKISNVPFPFPYAQTCDCLLVLHWFIVPFVVSQWCTHAAWAFVFSFIQVFTLWSLNMIAVELENPFGTDPNDIDGVKMQLQMNHHLRLLLRETTRQTPTLRLTGEDMKELTLRVVDDPVELKASFFQLWEEMDETSPQAKSPRRYNPKFISSRERSTDHVPKRSSRRSRCSTRSADTLPPPTLTSVWEPCGDRVENIGPPHEALGYVVAGGRHCDLPGPVFDLQMAEVHGVGGKAGTVLKEASSREDSRGRGHAGSLFGTPRGEQEASFRSGQQSPGERGQARHVAGSGPRLDEDMEIAEERELAI